MQERAQYEMDDAEIPAQDMQDDVEDEEDTATLDDILNELLEEKSEIDDDALA